MMQTGFSSQSQRPVGADSVSEERAINGSTRDHIFDMMMGMDVERQLGVHEK